MTETMDNALDLMAVGMGFVFSFLIILVLVTMLMSALVRRFGPAEPEPTPRTSSTTSPGTRPAEDQQLTAVIAAAISKYRARHKK